MNVLILLPHYLPGFKAGGPIRSIANLVSRLGEEIDFRIVTADRDAGDQQSYPDVDPADWQRVGQAHVRYLARSRWSPRRLAELMRDSHADVLYVNSFFNPRTGAAPLTLMGLRLLPALPVIVAPRGEFSPGALALKPWKKAAYLAAMKSLGVSRRVVWHATSELERRDIERVMGRRARVVVAPNLSLVDCEPATRDNPKRPGELRLVFLSRIDPKKNLLGALEMLPPTPGRVSLDVWGPIEHTAYWRRCRACIQQLPARITVNHCGDLPPDRVAATLGQYDALLLPTHGENYGHVIIESLCAGCPVVISDRTPWRDLERDGVGWDLPLNRPQEFHRAIATLSAMDESMHRELRRRAASFGRKIAHNPAAVESSRQLFRAAA